MDIITLNESIIMLVLGFLEANAFIEKKTLIEMQLVLVALTMLI